MSRRRWDPCISHYDDDAQGFIADYFGNPRRQVALIAGAGFDPRTTLATEALARSLGPRLQGLFLREQRSGSHASLTESAEANARRLQELVPNCRAAPFPVFSTDNATVGGRRVVDAVRSEAWTNITDLVVDLSALSVGVSFPLVRLLYERSHQQHVNLHVLVTDHPAVDSDIEGISSEKAETIFGFKGGLGLDDTSGVTVLWLPQLDIRRRKALARVHATLTEHQEVDVCPILPFPSRNPRRGDELIEHYQEEFESTWRVDARDLVYVDERKPVDLYRSILEIDDARQRVFRKLGGSLTVLSPFGSKVHTLGALMAALERDFPVMYVETLAYTASTAVQSPGELVHVWLHGEAYGDDIAAVSAEVRS